MYAGRLNERVIIYNFTTTTLPSGQRSETWHKVAEVWAEVRGISGKEQIYSGAEKAEGVVRVWLRYRNDISSTSRIECITGAFKGITLDIIAPPVPDIKNDRMEILCKQGVKP